MGDRFGHWTRALFSDLVTKTQICTIVRRAHRQIGLFNPRVVRREVIALVAEGADPDFTWSRKTGK
eukprot:8052252-Pyramimonas_sp.AAC.1